MFSRDNRTTSAASSADIPSSLKTHPSPKPNPNAATSLNPSHPVTAVQKFPWGGPSGGRPNPDRPVPSLLAPSPCARLFLPRIPPPPGAGGRDLRTIGKVYQRLILCVCCLAYVRSGGEEPSGWEPGRERKFFPHACCVAKWLLAGLVLGGLVSLWRPPMLLLRPRVMVCGMI